MTAVQIRRRSAARAGFTLVELLVSVAILAIIMLLVTQMVGDTSKVWQKTSGKIDAFRQARLGFEEMTTQLAQATTNTYWDYFNAAGQTVAQWNAAQAAAGTANPFVPVAYGRQSELHFISGNAATVGFGPVSSGFYLASGTAPYTHSVFFTWPGGYVTNSTNSSLNSLLTPSGYCIEFSGDIGGAAAYFANGPPTSVLTNYKSVSRFRLVQLLQFTEYLHVYDYSLTSNTVFNNWYYPELRVWPAPKLGTQVNIGHDQNARIVANNVIALVIWPKKINNIRDTDPNVSGDSALAPFYSYDSRQGLDSGIKTSLATKSQASAVSLRTTSGIPTATTPYLTWTPGAGPQPLQMNQMPPLLQVAMVSLDETSGNLLQNGGTAVPAQITAALSGLFVNAGPPATAPSYTSPDPSYDSTMSFMDNDLAVLQSRLGRIGPNGTGGLRGPKINFQVFETTIAIRNAKFANP